MQPFPEVPADRHHARYGAETLPFEELCQRLEVEDFDLRARRLIRKLDRDEVRIFFHFRRKDLAPARSRDLLQRYRWEVQRIPVMDREEELRFCMGVELLWRRLQRARRAAGFSAAQVEVQPGLEDHPCPECQPGRLRTCFGCAPAELPGPTRERLRHCTREFVLARNELIERNLHIVFRLLERYKRTGVPVEDLIQEANQSLFKAVEGFDFTRGVRFKTYASYWVNQAFLNAIYNQSRTVRVPAYIQKAMKKINDATGAVGGGLFDQERISEVAGIPVDLVDTAITGNRFTLSLDRALDDGEGTRMSDLVEDETAVLDYDSMEESRLGEYLHEALDALSPRERLILQLRFGLDGERVHTLAEVGQRLEISLERVRQIQKAALVKIRRGSQRDLLEQYN